MLLIGPVGYDKTGENSDCFHETKSRATLALGIKRNRHIDMRHDHTRWLTHFVRDRLPEQDFPEGGIFDPVGGELEPDANAFSVLAAIIRLGGIVPGYSFRRGRTTIYGGEPAVCATEMPLYSFAQYVRSRANTAKVSAYGIAFLKKEFYLAGGRPVFYGLSIENPQLVEDKPTCRVFHDSVLPRPEQYRYVAYNPSSLDKWVDWSHEREWRWVARDKRREEVCAIDGGGCFDSTPALPIFKGALDGGQFSRICIIVWTHEEATEIRRLLTGFYLAGNNNYETPFDRKIIERSHIIALQDVVKLVETGKILEAQTIEGLQEENLLAPITLTVPPRNAAEVVTNAMAKAGNAAKAAVEAYTAKHGVEGGYCGFANATTWDVTAPIVQYLLRVGLASGPYDGRVFVEFPREFPASQSLDYNEAGVEAACEVLSAELGVSVYCHSRAD